MVFKDHALKSCLENSPLEAFMSSPAVVGLAEFGQVTWTLTLGFPLICVLHHACLSVLHKYTILSKISLIQP